MIHLALGKASVFLFCIFEDLIRKANEWGLLRWLVSLDLSKVFDSVNHKALFNVFELQGVSDGLISIIKLLYKNQTSRVDDSKRFPIDRGEKESDILSLMVFNAMVFNAIMEIVMRNWKNQVIDRGFLLDAASPRLQSTRFANDLLLFARSCEKVMQMLELLQLELDKDIDK